MLAVVVVLVVIALEHNHWLQERHTRLLSARVVQQKQAVPVLFFRQ
jgi:hypothetical protein